MFHTCRFSLCYLHDVYTYTGQVMFLVYLQISMQELLDDFNDILNDHYSPGGHLILVYFNSLL